MEIFTTNDEKKFIYFKSMKNQRNNFIAVIQVLQTQN